MVSMKQWGVLGGFLGLGQSLIWIVISFSFLIVHDLDINYKVSNTSITKTIYESFMKRDEPGPNLVALFMIVYLLVSLFWFASSVYLIKTIHYEQDDPLTLANAKRYSHLIWSILTFLICILDIAFTMAITSGSIEVPIQRTIYDARYVEPHPSTTCTTKRSAEKSNELGWMTLTKREAPPYKLANKTNERNIGDQEDLNFKVKRDVNIDEPKKTNSSILKLSSMMKAKRYTSSQNNLTDITLPPSLEEAYEFVAKESKQAANEVKLSEDELKNLKSVTLKTINTTSQVKEAAVSRTKVPKLQKSPLKIIMINLTTSSSHLHSSPPTKTKTVPLPSSPVERKKITLPSSTTIKTTEKLETSSLLTKPAPNILEEYKPQEEKTSSDMNLEEVKKQTKTLQPTKTEELFVTKTEKYEPETEMEESEPPDEDYATAVSVESSEVEETTQEEHELVNAPATTSQDVEQEESASVEQEKDSQAQEWTADVHGRIDKFSDMLKHKMPVIEHGLQEHKDLDYFHGEIETKHSSEDNYSHPSHNWVEIERNLRDFVPKPSHFETPKVVVKPLKHIRNFAILVMLLFSSKFGIFLFINFALSLIVFYIASKYAKLYDEEKQQSSPDRRSRSRGTTVRPRLLTDFDTANRPKAMGRNDKHLAFSMPSPKE